MGSVMSPGRGGGVGFRRLREVYSAFSCKLWWSFRAGSSLWAEFMRAKYCKGLHPGQVEMRPHDSPAWRRMLNISRQVELSMVWLVNGGTCNFWFDNWMGSGALCLKTTATPGLNFKDFIANGVWDVNRLGQHVTQEQLHQILRYPVPSSESNDEVIWRLTASGKFTLASTFHDIRQAGNTSVLHSQVWHPQIPLKISFFMLRLLGDRLPLTAVLWRVGVQLASKCLCCPEGAAEQVEHVFSEGQVAQEVWDYFGRLCGVVRRGSTLRAWLMAWWMAAPRSDKC
ncbi:uncharacterized protein [Coffea arabica]|uniref:Reverse transcriptase zinc-binding domain-containing protein n=1 Tax=Coffea arabica TaxID=13443 RepID=A0A6P6SNN2_COFAR|nr:uncharacterized protein LOC113693109 [Coffea arabica]